MAIYFTELLQRLNELLSFFLENSSTIAWRIPWTEKPGRLQSMGRTELDRTEATWQAAVAFSELTFFT